MKIARLLLYVACVLAGYSMFVMFSARWHAASLVGGKPFCIQVPAEHGYKPLSSIFELAGIFNRIKSGGTGLNHAVLIVGELKEDPLQRNDWPLELYHWSNLFNKFEAGAYSADGKMPPIYCKPQVEYFSHLKEAERRNPGKMDIYYGGIGFSIPREYHPKAYWGSGGGIFIYACAPWFEPSNKSECDGIKNSTKFIDIAFEVPERLKFSSELSDPEFHIESDGIEFGLEKSQFWRLPRGLERGSPAKVTYAYFDSSKQIQTRIYCVNAVDAPCLHEFRSDILSYRFRHSRSDIREWREMQSRLETIGKSFLVKPIMKINK